MKLLTLTAALLLTGTAMGQTSQIQTKLTPSPATEGSWSWSSDAQVAKPPIGQKYTCTVERWAQWPHLCDLAEGKTSGYDWLEKLEPTVWPVVTGVHVSTDVMTRTAMADPRGDTRVERLTDDEYFRLKYLREQLAAYEVEVAKAHDVYIPTPETPCPPACASTGISWYTRFPDKYTYHGQFLIIDNGGTYTLGGGWTIVSPATSGDPDAIKAISSPGR